MKIFKKALIGLAGFVALLVVIGLFLPSSAHVERSVTIQAPPSAVFPLINDLRAFNEWSPWARIDPNTQYRFEGPESGTGAKMTWASEHPDVGSGSQEIIASEADRRVTVALDFGAQGTATAYYDILAQDDGTLVTWGFDTDFGYDLVSRYFGLLFDRLIGADYEKGLVNLKELAESQSASTQSNE